MEATIKQFSRACPFLKSNSAASLRQLSHLPAHATGFVEAGTGNVRGNALFFMAQKCPVMGKALAIQSKNYLHTSARLAKQPTRPLNQALIQENRYAPKSISHCPVSHSTNSKHFDYETLYRSELEKKHQDKSYRYFNNINRLAQKFPKAHTANLQEEVTVWCSNDYLGMGRNPLVLKTMQ